MATILTDRLLSPRVGSTAADLFTTSRVTRRRSTELSETFKRFWSVTCEGLLLLWMIIAVVFSLLIAAGAVGLLG
jgi:Flp pilus assembly protein TadB